MEGYSGWLQNCFHPINGSATTHEYLGYHLELKDHLTPASCLICKIVHEGPQADASTTEKIDNWSHYEGQYLWGTFEIKREHLPFV